MQEPTAQPKQHKAEFWPTGHSGHKDRRRWLMGLASIALVVFNYPWMFVIEEIFEPPWPAVVLFASWLFIIIAAAFILMRKQSRVG